MISKLMIASGLATLATSGFVHAQSVSDWTGGYVGGSLAAVSASGIYCEGENGDEYDCTDADSGLPTPEPSGGMFGLRAGYDFANGPYVFGVMGDLMFGDLSDAADDSDDPGYGCLVGCQLDVSQVAMVRGRVGYPMGQYMPYASAGVAVSSIEASFNPDLLEEGSFTNFVVGAGADYKLSDTLTAGLDLAYLLPTTNYFEIEGFCGGCGVTSYSATILSASVSYNF